MIAFISLLAFASVHSIAAWGNNAHEATGAIAQTLLTVNGSNFANSRVGDSRTLINATTWAESSTISSLAWTTPLHFQFQSINQTDPSMCHSVPNRDCPANGCLSSAMANFTSQMQSASLSINQNPDAFRFLIHFVADSMQPLHVGFRSDEGGQMIFGLFNNQSTNLHAIWDDLMIDYMVKSLHNGSYSTWQSHLVNQLQSTSNQTIREWLSCPHGDSINGSFAPCTSVWIDESAQYACSAAYQSDQHWITPATSFNLSIAYAESNWPLLEQRLIQSGVRMAYVINKLADPNCCEPPVVPYVNTDVIVMTALGVIAGVVCLVVGIIFGVKRYRARHSEFDEALVDDDSEESTSSYQRA